MDGIASRNMAVAAVTYYAACTCRVPSIRGTARPMRPAVDQLPGEGYLRAVEPLARIGTDRQDTLILTDGEVRKGLYRKNLAYFGRIAQLVRARP